MNECFIQSNYSLKYKKNNNIYVLFFSLYKYNEYYNAFQSHCICFIYKLI